MAWFKSNFQEVERPGAARERSTRASRMLPGQSPLGFLVGLGRVQGEVGLNK